MRNSTYRFDELPIRAQDGQIIAYVGGEADVELDATGITDMTIVLETHGPHWPSIGSTVVLGKTWPLYQLVRVEVIRAWEEGQFDEDRPVARDENDEHRLTWDQVR